MASKSLVLNGETQQRQQKIQNKYKINTKNRKIYRPVKHLRRSKKRFNIAWPCLSFVTLPCPCLLCVSLTIRVCHL